MRAEMSTPVVTATSTQSGASSEGGDAGVDLQFEWLLSRRDCDAAWEYIGRECDDLVCPYCPRARALCEQRT